MNAKNGIRSVHPGEILREELDVFEPLENALGVPVNQTTRILNDQPGVNAKLGVVAGTVFWDNVTSLAEPSKDLAAWSGRGRSGPPIAERLKPRQTAALGE